MLKPADVLRTGSRRGYSGPIFKLQMLNLVDRLSLELVLLTHKFYDCEVHWFGKVSRICTLPSGHCLPCERGNPTRPLYYGFAQVKETKQVGCLKVTPTMLIEEPRLSRVQTCRGVVVRYYRRKNCSNGRPCIEVIGDVFNVSELPASPDVESFILKMYSKIVSKEGQEN